MKSARGSINLKPFLAGLFAFSCLCAQTTAAQQADLQLQIEGNTTITNAQIINATAFLTRENKSLGLFTIFIKNNRSESAEELYLDIVFLSESRGELWHRYQVNTVPFSLKPDQQVYSPNVQAIGLPGTPYPIFFRGGLTASGKELFNELDGGTRLPADFYTIQVCIYQGGNQVNGGVRVACAQQTFGSKIVEDVRDIYLNGPGDAVGSNAEISNVYPYFSWSEITGLSYRLVIVEAQDNQPPESAINSALSTAPILKNGAPAAGTLLTHENADVIISKANFQYPTSGVQSLESGKRYYWQVFTVLDENSQVETISSEIWSFRISEESGLSTGDVKADYKEILSNLIGRDLFLEMKSNGFSLQGVQVDGKIYTAQELAIFLKDFMEKVQQDSITVVN